MHMSDGRVVSNFILQALRGQPITVRSSFSRRILFLWSVWARFLSFFSCILGTRYTVCLQNTVTVSSIAFLVGFFCILYMFVASSYCRLFLLLMSLAKY